MRSQTQNQASSTTLLIRTTSRLIVVFGVISLIVTGLIFTTPAYAYSCTGLRTSNTHCYGQMVWLGRIGGGFTQVTVVPLSAPATQSEPNADFITETLWVVDTQSIGCQGNHPCWVEVGYATYGNPNGYFEQAYYTAWQPPGGSYAELQFGSVPLGSYGKYCYLRDTQEKNGIVNVGVCDYAGINIDISLAPTRYEEGSELGGTAHPQRTGSITYTTMLASIRRHIHNSQRQLR